MIQIYLIQNSINNKKYVGQTNQILSKRFSRHCWKSELRKNMIITQAIHKYGKNKFTISKIDEAYSLEEANRKEVYWCEQYSCISPNGYNLKAGGRMFVNTSKETRMKISKANTGRKASEITKERLRISHLGQKSSPESIAKRSAFFKGKKPHKNVQLGASIKNAKDYVLISPTGEVTKVTNMRRFAKENNHQHTNLSSLVNKRIPSYKGWTLQKI